MILGPKGKVWWRVMKGRCPLVHRDFEVRQTASEHLIMAYLKYNTLTA
jgi:hypothetical protein